LPPARTIGDCCERIKHRGFGDVDRLGDGRCAHLPRPRFGIADVSSRSSIGAYEVGVVHEFG